MNERLANNRKATIDTITLIEREYSFLQKKGEEEKIIDFLSSLESKANVRVVLLKEGKSRISSPIPEASSPDYWRAVLILIKHARITYLEDKNSFLLFLAKFKAHLKESEDPEPEVLQTEVLKPSISAPKPKISEDVESPEPKTVIGDKSPYLPRTSVKSGKISVMGLDRAGKTTLIQRLKTGQFLSNPAQTIGVNTETININSNKYTIWDLGGEALFRRALWEMYTKNTAGLVFVIDLVDQQRFSEAQQSLNRVINMSHLAHIPLVLFFNKSDLLVRLPDQNLLHLLGISEIRGRESAVFRTSAKTGEGINEGISWLTQNMQQNIKKIENQ